MKKVPLGKKKCLCYKEYGNGYNNTCLTERKTRECKDKVMGDGGVTQLAKCQTGIST